MVGVDKKSGARVLKQFFGLKPEQKISDFVVELKALTPEEKSQLCEGIENGTLTY
jgi:hypothetical protein